MDRRELISTWRDGELDERLRDAAAEIGVDDLSPAEIHHLETILTSPLLVARSLAELVHLADLLDSLASRAALRTLTAERSDDATLHRLIAVPEHVRALGDKCLFEAGVARRQGPAGIDLRELGSRAYDRASHVLALLADDRNLRRYYEQNTVGAMSIDDEVGLLERLAGNFEAHVGVLRALLRAEAAGSPVVGASGDAEPTRPGPSAGDARPEARDQSTAVVPIGGAVQPDGGPLDEPDTAGDRSARIANLRIVSRTEEEIRDDTVRRLLAAEKTILFSALDTEELRDALKRVVIFQEGAIDSLCDELSLYSMGTQDPRKPASYFLVGPTGVGKNHLVESLCSLFEDLWGIEVPYLELEGPEFTYPSDINELKGAARGFIRSDEEGIMTQFHQKAHDKPFSVILVDEVEKAHPQLRRFFLPLMDRGTMMDNRGRTLHFVNTTFFFTSNMGYSDANRGSQPIGYGDGETKDRAVASVADGSIRKTLSPEFINRVHLIHFRHLSREAVERIFELEFDKIRRRYRRAQGLRLDITEAARRELIERGYSHEYGARNLKKVLNREANIEVSKSLKRDEHRESADVSQLLARIHEMRDGKRPIDLDEVKSEVKRVARVQVPYQRVTIDFRGGRFVHDKA